MCHRGGRGQDPSPNSNKQEPMRGHEKQQKRSTDRLSGHYTAAERFTASTAFTYGQLHVQLGCLQVGLLRAQEVYSWVSGFQNWAERLCPLCGTPAICLVWSTEINAPSGLTGRGQRPYFLDGPSEPTCSDLYHLEIPSWKTWAACVLGCAGRPCWSHGPHLVSHAFGLTQPGMEPFLHYIRGWQTVNRRPIPAHCLFL